MTPPQPAEAQAVHARRALGFILMSAAVPGSVQSFAGNRGLGRIAGRVYGAAALLGVLVLLGLWLWRGPTVGVLLTPWVATIVRFALWVLFAGWVLLLLDSWRLARPLRLPRRPRLVLTITSLVLALAVGGVTTVAANALVAARNVGEVFGGGGEAEIKDGRYNVLLLGADSAADRQGLRPDSINVASVDAQTGRTVLFGLPRNLQKVRFPDSSPLNELYPDGFVCEDNGCMLNGIWTLGEEHADLYPGQQAGLEAMKEAVGEALGLGLNYAAYEAEIYRAGMQAIPLGQMEAATVLGMSKWLALRRILVPQAVRIALPGVTNDFIALLKDSSLVSVITVVELTKHMAITAVDVRSWALPGMLCAALYMGMSYPLSKLSQRLEARLDRK